MTAPMPRDTAIRKLDQISRWKNQISDAHADLVGLHSTWQVGSLHGATASDVPLPHGLDAAFDDVDTLGATGIRTETGANEMLESLAIMAGNHVGTRITNAYLLRETLWLYPEDFWHSWDEWETFAEELQQTWSVVARLTGRSSETLRPCPECGGKIKVRMTDTGRSDEGKCATCGETFDLSGPDWDKALLERLRSPKISRTVLVDRKQLKSIWPNLNFVVLRKRVERSKQEKVDGRYVLADINAWLC